MIDFSVKRHYKFLSPYLYCFSFKTAIHRILIVWKKVKKKFKWKEKCTSSSALRSSPLVGEERLDQVLDGHAELGAEDTVETRLLLHSYTVWCNQMGTVFEEMSSWAALIWHLGIKTTFLKRKFVWNVIIMIFF